MPSTQNNETKDPRHLAFGNLAQIERVKETRPPEIGDEWAEGVRLYEVLVGRPFLEYIYVWAQDKKEAEELTKGYYNVEGVCTFTGQEM